MKINVIIPVDIDTSDTDIQDMEDEIALEAYLVLENAQIDHNYDTIEFEPVEL